MIDAQKAMQKEIILNVVILEICSHFIIIGKEENLEDCNHGQIVHLVDIALGELNANAPQKELLRAFFVDKQLDGRMLTEYKRKAFGIDIAKYGDDTKLKGKAMKLWKALYTFDIAKIRGNDMGAVRHGDQMKGLLDDDVDKKEEKEQIYSQSEDSESAAMVPKDQMQILDSFCNLTDCEREIGVVFLRDSEWSLPIALERFYDFLGDATKLESWESDKSKKRRTVSDAVYTEGVRFWYWARDKKPQSATFVNKRHNNLKQEMLATRYVNMKSWKRHEKTCQLLMESDIVRKMTANGNGHDIYGILLGAPMQLQFVTALKLYTDFDALNKEFCEHFRLKKLTENAVESKQSLAVRNGRFWNLAKLLTESVQCFGQLLVAKKNRFYRGVNRLFIFPRFVARFHAPLSTSKSVCHLISFLYDGNNRHFSQWPIYFVFAYCT